MKNKIMKKRISIIAGVVLLVAAAVFVFYTTGHPDAVPWSKRLSFLLFGALVWLIYECLIDIPFLQERRAHGNRGNLLLAAFFYVFALIFVIMEASGILSVNIFTMIRGFVIPAVICLGTEQLILRYKSKKNGG